MKIALVVHDYHRQGGHSRYCAELAERFAQDHEVHVFANSFPAGAPLHPQPARRGLSLYFHLVVASRATAIGTVLSFFLPASRQVRRHGPFDVVHAQGFATLGYNVLTAHICCAAWHEARLQSGFRLNWRERVFDNLVSRAEKWLYSRQPSTPLIAISHRVASDLKRFYGRSEELEIIPHGVDLKEFDVSQRDDWRRRTRSELNLQGSDFAALWVGDLRKGAKAAIEAVALNPGQHLLAVSRNDPAPFLAIASAAGIASRVHFLPPTQEIARFYAAADAFLFPTTYDAFGMVVLEAMAMGLPSIVSADCGAAELIEDGVDGLLLNNPLDAQEAARHLAVLAQDPELRLAMSGAARVKAAIQSWDEVAERTLQVYRRAINRRTLSPDGGSR